MVFLRSPGCGRTVVAHLDGDDGQLEGGALDVMLEEFSEVERCDEELGVDEVLQVWLVGAFLDATVAKGEPQQGEVLCGKVLELLHGTKRARVRLMCATVLELNTVELEDGDASVTVPRVRGACMNVRTGELVPALFDDVVRGPELPARSVRGFMGKPHLERVYDDIEHVYRVGPFEYEPFGERECSMLLALPPGQMLHFTSSSPASESDEFVPHMIEVLKFMQANPSSAKYFADGPHVYAWDTSKRGWRRVEEVQ